MTTGECGTGCHCVYEDCNSARYPGKGGGCYACGRCQCGCGNLAPIAKGSDRPKGYERGKPSAFIRGHARLASREGWPSNAKLLELYRDGMSTVDLGKHISAMAGRPVTARQVYGQLVKLGITPRDRGEAKSLWYKFNPDAAKRLGRNLGTLDHKRKCSLTHADRVKGARIAAKNRRVPREHRPCAWCQKLIVVKVTSARICCSLSCAGKHRWHEVALRKISEAKFAPPPIKIPEWARENVERLRQLQSEGDIYPVMREAVLQHRRLIKRRDAAEGE